jgi:hypothetical protein
MSLGTPYFLFNFIIFEEVDSFDELFQYGYDPSKTEDEMRMENNFEPDMVLTKLLPNPGPQNVHKLWSSVTSLIVLRHPMDRLVSLYNNKFIARVEVNQLWADYAYYIKENYRKEGADDKYVTPQEMIR